MGTRIYLLAGHCSKHADGLVVEREPDAGVVAVAGAVDPDVKLEGVVEAPLDGFGGVGDVEVADDGQRVEQLDVLCRRRLAFLLQRLDLGRLVRAFGFEGVEAVAQPVAERPVGRVGGLQLRDEPVLPPAWVGDLLQEHLSAGIVGNALPAGLVGQRPADSAARSGPKTRVATTWSSASVRASSRT